MTKSREKKTVYKAAIKREDAEAAFADLALADAKIQKSQAEMDMKMTKIREHYADELAVLADLKQAKVDYLNAYADQNPELFIKKKSFEFQHGIIGYRTGTPKLKTRKGFTWPAVTELLKTYLPGYVRTSEEPAKDLLLAERENPEVSDMFTKVGVYVDQDETFYVEPKKEI